MPKRPPTRGATGALLSNDELEQAAACGAIRVPRGSREGARGRGITTQWVEGSPDFVMMYVPTDPILGRGHQRRSGDLAGDVAAPPRVDRYAGPPDCIPADRRARLAAAGRPAECPADRGNRPGVVRPPAHLLRPRGQDGTRVAPGRRGVQRRRGIVSVARAGAGPPFRGA